MAEILKYKTFSSDLLLKTADKNEHSTTSILLNLKGVAHNVWLIGCN